MYNRAAMSHTASTPELEYIRKRFAPQDALLDAIDSELERIGKQINIGAEEGKLLQMLIKLRGVKTIVEVGTLAGYSAIWMARALPEDGLLYTIDRESEHVALAKKFIGQSDVNQQIIILESDALKGLAELSVKGPFDMIFIDADKNNYGHYLDWAEINLKQGGMIVADNTLLFGAMAQDKPPEGTAPSTWESMRRFNERLSDPKKYFGTMIPTEQGMTVAIKLF
jgi:predicted O-methyltransferase YrrM